ncbi:hypothetical protein KKA03_06945 [archaeon]|nr:hypothetical protein [archaeon]
MEKKWSMNTKDRKVCLGFGITFAILGYVIGYYMQAIPELRAFFVLLIELSDSTRTSREDIALMQAIVWFFCGWIMGIFVARDEAKEEGLL